MEQVRRRKLCRHILKMNPKTKLQKVNKYGVKIQEQHRTCSNRDVAAHPYEDHINLVHVLNDTLDTSFTYAAQLDNRLKYFIHMTDLTPTAQCLLQRSEASVDVNIRLNSEVHYADKNEEWLEGDLDEKPYLASIMDENQKRKMIPCDSYMLHVDFYIEKSMKYISLRESRSERRVHQKKLKVFQALRTLRDHAPFELPLE